MQKSDRHHTMLASRERHIGGELQHALGAHKVGLEVRAERIAAPGDAGNAESGFAEQGIVNGDTEGSLLRNLMEHGATNHGEDLIRGKPML